VEEVSQSHSTPELFTYKLPEPYLLLREVLNICRNKSSVSLTEWKDLKSNIEKLLNLEAPDLTLYEKPRVVIKFKDERAYADLSREVIQLRKERVRLKRISSIYRQREQRLIYVLCQPSPKTVYGYLEREKDISRILKSSLNTKYKGISQELKDLYHE